MIAVIEGILPSRFANNVFTLLFFDAEIIKLVSKFKISYIYCIELYIMT